MEHFRVYYSKTNKLLYHSLTPQLPPSYLQHTPKSPSPSSLSSSSLRPTKPPKNQSSLSLSLIKEALQQPNRNIPLDSRRQMNFHIQIQLDSNFQRRIFFVFFSLSVGLFLPKKKRKKKKMRLAYLFFSLRLLLGGRKLAVFSSSSSLRLLAGPGFLPPVKPPTAESLPVRAPVAPVGFLLFLFLLICTLLGGFLGREGCRSR